MMIAYSIVSINKKTRAITHLCGLMDAPNESVARKALEYEYRNGYDEWTTPQILVNACINENLVDHFYSLSVVSGAYDSPV